MRKTLVFVDFIDSVELIQDVCIKNSVDSYTINGNMSALGRQQNIVAYEGHTGQAVFILTQRASSIGINLTSTTHIVLFEPGLYNAVERQAIGRAVRIGQVNSVEVIRLVTSGTIEEAISRRSGDNLLSRSSVVALLQASEAIEASEASEATEALEIAV
jgi:SNF2 family DNA or RNA helicase